jgi:hypothetical protein
MAKDSISWPPIDDKWRRRNSAAFFGDREHMEDVLWLQERGFSMDTIDAFGEPVIFVVAQLGYKELFSWFVSKGANVSAKNRDGVDLISH